MGISKYAWIGNRISEADMKHLWMIKQVSKKPITVMIAEAVNEYIKKKLPDAMPPKENKNGDKQ